MTDCGRKNELRQTAQLSIAEHRECGECKGQGDIGVHGEFGNVCVMWVTGKVRMWGKVENVGDIGIIGNVEHLENVHVLMLNM